MGLWTGGTSATPSVERSSNEVPAQRASRRWDEQKNGASVLEAGETEAGETQHEVANAGQDRVLAAGGRQSERKSLAR